MGCEFEMNDWICVDLESSGQLSKFPCPRFQEAPVLRSIFRTRDVLACQKPLSPVLWYPKMLPAVEVTLAQSFLPSNARKDKTKRKKRKRPLDPFNPPMRGNPLPRNPRNPESKNQKSLARFRLNAWTESKTNKGQSLIRNKNKQVLRRKMNDDGIKKSGRACPSAEADRAKGRRTRAVKTAFSTSSSPTRALCQRAPFYARVSTFRRMRRYRSPNW